MNSLQNRNINIEKNSILYFKITNLQNIQKLISKDIHKQIFLVKPVMNQTLLRPDHKQVLIKKDVVVK